MDNSEKILILLEKISGQLEGIHDLLPQKKINVKGSRHMPTEPSKLMQTISEIERELEE